MDTFGRLLYQHMSPSLLVEFRMVARRIAEIRCTRAPNNCRIDCETAPHGDGTSGTGVAPTADWPANARVAVRSRFASAAKAARANIRRFVNLLQPLDGGTYTFLSLVASSGDDGDGRGTRRGAARAQKPGTPMYASGRLTLRSAYNLGVRRRLTIKV